MTKGEDWSWLRKEWLAGRTFQIFERMYERLRDSATEFTEVRLGQILESQPHPEAVRNLRPPGLSLSEETLARISIAYSQAMAEHVLLVVSMELAELETSQQPPSP